MTDKDLTKVVIDPLLRWFRNRGNMMGVIRSSPKTAVIYTKPRSEPIEIARIIVDPPNLILFSSMTDDPNGKPLHVRSIKKTIELSLSDPDCFARAQEALAHAVGRYARYLDALSNGYYLPRHHYHSSEDYDKYNFRVLLIESKILHSDLTRESIW